MTPRQRAPVLGASIDVLGWDEAVERIAAWAARRESRVVCLCNAHSVVTAGRDAGFARALADADLCAPDGAPVAWMLRRSGHPLQPRISGPDLMRRCLERAERDGLPIFLLGSTAATLQRLVAAAAQCWPRLRIAGSASPPFRPLSDEEDAALAQQINDSGAALVFVALGCPKQELWMAAQRGRVQGVMLGVGAAFDFHAGTLRRAPMWMQHAGLEWLFRLATEPRRLGWRYLDTNTAFMLGALRQWLAQRRSR